MKLFRLLIVLLIIGCSSNNQSVSNTSSLDYDVLDSFIKDSLPSTLDLDTNYSDVFEQWKDINLINTVKKNNDYSEILQERFQNWKNFYIRN